MHKNMEIVSEGSLESISRPSSTSSERTRSKTSAKHTLHKQKLLHSGSLEVLPPEGQGSKNSFAFGSPNQIISLVEKDIAMEDLQDYSGNEDVVSSGSLSEDTETPRSEDIKEEQTVVFGAPENDDDSQVQEESGEPGDQIAMLETGSSDAEEVEDKEEEELDPKIKKGLERIMKLDKILASKTKKEREVKIHRRQLEKMWQEKLKQLELEREEEGQGKPVELGPAHLLALGAPAGGPDDTGVEEDIRTVTPLFATQPPVNEDRHMAGSPDTHTGDNSNCRTDSGSICDDSDSRSSPSDKKTGEKGKRHGRKTRDKKKDRSDQSNKKKNQNFIKRNIELAGDAANLIPMTEEEKQRIDEIMSEDTDQLMLDTPFTDSLSLAPGTGYQPDEEESRALADIDMKLQSLLPPEELELLSSRDLCSSISQESMRSLSTLRGGDEGESENLDIGERVLREEKQMRDMKERLLAIEDQLKEFDSVQEDDSQVRLSDELLAKLLAGSRTTSRSTSISETVWSALSTPTPTPRGDSEPSHSSGGLDSRSSSRHSKLELRTDLN